MSITVEDVKHWRILEGIGHIVVATNGYWCSTACRQMTPNGEDVKDTPKRKCRKCMAELPNLVPSTGAAQ